MGSTLKENIILNKEFDENKFKEILKVTKLDELIKNLPEEKPYSLIKSKFKWWTDTKNFNCQSFI